MSVTYTRSTTFTIAHARRLSSKVAADMHLCAMYYGKPSEALAHDYAEELAQLLKGGYVAQYEFGYKRDGKRVVCWRYTIHWDGTVTTDDRPGRVVATADVRVASFYNFLWYSEAWFELSIAERERIKAGLPVRRVSGSPPGDGHGYWMTDKTYSAGGVGVGRQTYRPYS